MYEATVILTVADKEMKALLVLALLLLASGSPLAFGAGDVAKGISAFTLTLTEPAYMLLSGTGLIALAGAVRKLSL